PNEPPTWTVLAKENLLLRELGKDWVECVDLWFRLEEKLGYGVMTGTRNALPSIGICPEEWGKFIMKTRGSVRNYETQPIIADSAEFGLAFMKWWHAMQPEDRQSAEAMPSPIYGLPDGAWAPLLKAGPNGLISVLTMAVWWGQAILSRSS
ncbi:hypothetical protein BJ912DRAFT_833020, partial [Pholiota molesta]